MFVLLLWVNLLFEWRRLVSLVQSPTWQPNKDGSVRKGPDHPARSCTTPQVPDGFNQTTRVFNKMAVLGRVLTIPPRAVPPRRARAVLIRSFGVFNTWNTCFTRSEHNRQMYANSEHGIPPTTTTHRAPSPILFRGVGCWRFWRTTT